MLDFIVKLLIKWYMRKTPNDELVTLLSLNIMAARRCAYDLKHASQSCDNEYERNLYYKRSQQWLNIFCPSGIKDYKHGLIKEINTLELKLEYYKKLCKDNNLKILEEDDIPF